MFLTKTRNLEIPLFIGYILLLHIASAVSDFVIDPYMAQHSINPYFIALFGPLWKLVFWILPTFLYIIYVNQCNPFTYLKLTTSIRKGLLWALAGILWFTLTTCYRHFLQGLPINLNLGFDTWLNVVLLVGFFEEIPFRGLVFQKLHEYMGFWPASLLASFLFVSLHLPYWFSLGKPLSYYPYNALYIFVFAFIMCFILK